MLYGPNEVVIPTADVYGFTISVPLEMAHFFQKGRNLREVEESMCLSTNIFVESYYFEKVKKALECAFSCNAYFNGMYEDGNQLRVNLKFPSCERMWNFAVQFVSVT